MENIITKESLKEKFESADEETIKFLEGITPKYEESTEEFVLNIPQGMIDDYNKLHEDQEKRKVATKQLRKKLIKKLMKDNEKISKEDIKNLVDDLEETVSGEDVNILLEQALSFSKEEIKKKIKEARIEKNKIDKLENLLEKRLKTVLKLDWEITYHILAPYDCGAKQLQKALDMSDSEMLTLKNKIESEIKQKESEEIIHTNRLKNLFPNNWREMDYEIIKKMDDNQEYLEKLKFINRLTDQEILNYVG
jgi:hypothetical protein